MSSVLETCMLRKILPGKDNNLTTIKISYILYGDSWSQEGQNCVAFKWIVIEQNEQVFQWRKSLTGSFPYEIVQILFVRWLFSDVLLYFNAKFVVWSYCSYRWYVYIASMLFLILTLLTKASLMKKTHIWYINL